MYRNACWISKQRPEKEVTELTKDLTRTESVVQVTTVTSRVSSNSVSCACVCFKHVWCLVNATNVQAAELWLLLFRLLLDWKLKGLPQLAYSWWRVIGHCFSDGLTSGIRSPYELIHTLQTCVEKWRPQDSAMSRTSQRRCPISDDITFHTEPIEPIDLRNGPMK